MSTENKNENPHSGSDFDDFLIDEDLYEIVQKLATEQYLETVKGINNDKNKSWQEKVRDFFVAGIIRRNI